MLIKLPALRISFFKILDNSCVTVSGFPFKPDRDSLLEPFLRWWERNWTVKK